MHRLTSLCVRHPWLTLFVTLATLFAAGRSALRNELAVGMEATLGADHPTLRRFETFLGVWDAGRRLQA
jgi:hypothetical protein